MNRLFTEHMNTETIVPIKDSITGGILYDIQNVHRNLFKNERKKTIVHKSLRLKDKRTYTIGNRSVESKCIFGSIIGAALYVLDKNGLLNNCSLDTSKITVDLRQVNCFGESKKSLMQYKSPLSVPCFCVVFYVRKDAGIKGGDFCYEGAEHEFDMKCEVISQGDVVIFQPSINHIQRMVCGVGCMDTISVFVPLKSG